MPRDSEDSITYTEPAPEQLEGAVYSEQTPQSDEINVPDQEREAESVEIPSTQALTEAPLITESGDRDRIRILIVTKDVTVFSEGSLANRRLLDLEHVFLEIHVIALTESDVYGTDTVRLGSSIWLYPTASKNWWLALYDGYHTARTQLSFGGGFRADVVIAEDIGEAGLVAWYIGKQFNRPVQYHIHQDFFDPAVRDLEERPAVYQWANEFILERATSIRTRSEFQRQAVLSAAGKRTVDVALLPQYHDLEAWKRAVPTLDLHAQFPQFKFIILHASSMNAHAHTQEVIQGCAKMLRRYQTIGLVILGNGPLRTQFERQVISLGLQNQIEFLPMPSDILSYLKSSQVFIHLSENAEEDEFLLQAAVLKVPIIANTHGIGGSLFVHEESACLCSATDTACIDNSLNRYLNENQDRARYALNASEIVFERVEQDYGAFLEAYATSVQQCIALAS